MSQDNITVITSYFIDQDKTEGYYYNVYKKDDYYRKKALYVGAITLKGEFVSCTCTGGSLIKKCYHSKAAKSIMEIPLV